jgi:hypothetical protein
VLRCACDMPCTLAACPRNLHPLRKRLPAPRTPAGMPRLHHRHVTCCNRPPYDLAVAAGNARLGHFRLGSPRRALTRASIAGKHPSRAPGSSVVLVTHDHRF